MGSQSPVHLVNNFYKTLRQSISIESVGGLCLEEGEGHKKVEE